MGCVASRTPVGENRTLRFPLSMKSRRERLTSERVSETWARLQPTHTSDGERERCAQTAGFFLPSSARECMDAACTSWSQCLDDQAGLRRVCTLLHASALNLHQCSFITWWILGSGYIREACASLYVRQEWGSHAACTVRSKPAAFCPCALSLFTACRRQLQTFHPSATALICPVGWFVIKITGFRFLFNLWRSH